MRGRGACIAEGDVRGRGHVWQGGCAWQRGACMAEGGVCGRGACVADTTRYGQ